jgi:hypothetical protein
MLLTWVLIVLSSRKSPVGIWALLLPWAIGSDTSRSRALRGSSAEATWGLGDAAANSLISRPVSSGDQSESTGDRVNRVDQHL